MAYLVRLLKLDRLQTLEGGIFGGKPVAVFFVLSGVFKVPGGLPGLLSGEDLQGRIAGINIGNAAGLKGQIDAP